MTRERQQAASVARPDREMPGSDLPPTGRIARRHDPDRFLLSLFAPAALRPDMWTLIAFNHELARAVEVTSRRATGSDESRLTGAIRLQWWRDVVEGGRRQHEVAEPLGRLLDVGRVDRTTLRSMVDAREAELDGPASDETAWWERFERGPGALARAWGMSAGLDGTALDRCVLAGAAYGAGATLLHRDSLAAHGRHPLPATGGEVASLARGVLGRLVPSPAGSRRAGRTAGAPLLHAVLARRDLRRVVAGAKPTERRPVGDTLAVAGSFLSGRLG